jgi:hypothetical protein
MPLYRWLLIGYVRVPGRRDCPRVVFLTNLCAGEAVNRHRVVVPVDTRILGRFMGIWYQQAPICAVLVMYSHVRTSPAWPRTLAHPCMACHPRAQSSAYAPYMFK